MVAFTLELQHALQAIGQSDLRGKARVGGALAHEWRCPAGPWRVGQNRATEVGWGCSVLGEAPALLTWAPDLSSLPILRPHPPPQQ